MHPEGILAICERPYSAKPRGFLVTLHGKRFEHGEELSPAAVHAVSRLVELIAGLLGDLVRPQLVPIDSGVALKSSCD